MKVDATVMGPELRQIASLARLAENIGFDSVYTAETRHDPFPPLAVAAEHTERIRLGAAIVPGFARSPLTLARLANDLQEYSRGRFVLGLGSQVKAPVERRFGAPFDPPVARIREVVQALHAIWAACREGAPPNFHGTCRRHRGTPLVTAPAQPYGPPKVFLSAVGPKLTELAGEIADGLILHGFSTARHLQETVVPALERGLRRSGRTWADFEVVAPGFIVTGSSAAAYARADRRVREAIACYGANPAYWPVLDAHGWGDLQAELTALARAGRWSELPGLIDDEVLDAFAVCGEPKAIPERLVGRYGGTCRRIMLSAPFYDDPGTWATVVARIHEMTSEPVPS